MSDSAIVTGNFDGCHIGHQTLFAALQREASARGLEPVLVTFSPHTRQILHPDSDFKVLTPLREKERCIGERFGLKVQSLDFSSISHLPFDAYVKDVLQDRFHARLWILGHDHRFGAGAAGGVAEASLLGLETLEVPPVMLDGAQVSSSRVRNALAQGDTELATRLLGRPYRILGRVIHGDARGRTLGFPTANLEYAPEKLLPAFGVYAGWLEWDGEKALAVANIGIRPTFGNKAPSVEVHLPGFSGDLYGKLVSLELILRIRDEMRFERLDDLVARIGEDIQVARSFLPQATRARNA